VDIWELVQAIKDKPDEEIAKMTSILPVTLTPAEVKQVRPIFEKASLQWLIFGPPEHVHKQIQTVLGKTRTKKLLAHFGL
jgi:hypothetical protein